jgi:O-acetyl-ADP-ribose deacetylase (regulator of RNase III)
VTWYLRLTLWYQRCREACAEAALKGKKKRLKQYELLRRHRPEIQVCPRGCGFDERARHDLVVRTGLSGRAKLMAATSFETKSCPNDGARLIRKCARCRKPILAPIADHCQFCGVPQPWSKDRRAATERLSVRYWCPEDPETPESARRAYDPAEHLFKVVAGLRDGKEVEVDVWVLDGDIAQLGVDAVISNDDVDGQMWSQSARSIRDAAGEIVEREAQSDRPFRLGHAWSTRAGELGHLRNVIHVASMSRYGNPSPGDVSSCLKAAFRLAIRDGHESLGLTAFGTGPAAITRNQWFSLFAAATAELFDTAELFPPDKEAHYPENFSIVLVLFEPRRFEEDVQRLRDTFRDAWTKMEEPHRATLEPSAEAPMSEVPMGQR